MAVVVQHPHWVTVRVIDRVVLCLECREIGNGAEGAVVLGGLNQGAHLLKWEIIGQTRLIASTIGTRGAVVLRRVTCAGELCSELPICDITAKQPGAANILRRREGRV